MQKINIHSKNKIDKNKLESKIKELLINDETYRPDVSITIYEGEINSIYFNFKSYIADIQRGQTPFTPAISIILQLNKRLKELK